MVKPERLYHAPTLLSFTYLFFIVPQAVATEYLELTSSTIDDTAYQITLFYAVLCIGCSWIGWHSRPYRKLLVWLERTSYTTSFKKFFYAISALALVANLAGFQLNRISKAGLVESVGGQMTGTSTKLFFVAKLIYIPYPYFIKRLVEKRTLLRFFLLSASIFSEVRTAIIHGRRGLLASLSFPWLLILYFQKRWTLPRYAIPLIVIAPLILVPALAILRFNFWRMLFSGQMSVSLMASYVRSYFLDNYPYDLLNAVNVISLSLKDGYFGFGSGFWNDIVFSFIPGQIIGDGFKESLYINISPLSYLRTRELSAYFDVKLGTTVTGLGSTFVEFGFFGALCFYFQARVMRTLWESSLRNIDISQIIYCFTTFSIFLSVTHNFSVFITSMIIVCIILLTLIRFSRAHFKEREHSQAPPAWPMT